MEMMMMIKEVHGDDDDDQRPVHHEKRFALLQATRDSEYVKKMYGGYFNVFVAAFGEEGEKWDLFMVVEGDFPELEELDSYDGFLISGSPYDAYSSEPWILRLCFLLQILDSMAKKVLGICFGHQVIARALGGKVGKSDSGWDLGIRKVNIVKDLPPLVTKLLFQEETDGLDDDDDDDDDDNNVNGEIIPMIPSSFSIIECHQDVVLEVPTGANVIAYSDKTGVEMFTIETHILGIQGHPEYTDDILNSIIDRLLLNQDIQEDLAENARNMLQKTEPDRKYLGKICRKFLKGRQI
ncbi:gamma-glutamyl peptidase 5-like [Humulus lupulus]|uniref:gamma-glutamyl peptidase 5-like n=1 Tax=Humulus lupulus TaxID=3486 RepID=UPI002B4024ED|nr:gamma-glutamyl peptidase 5-like [Humulus lupulus]